MSWFINWKVDCGYDNGTSRQSLVVSLRNVACGTGFTFWNLTVLGKHGDPGAVG